jgi:4-azaleucine resistance transporter AzlC
MDSANTRFLSGVKAILHILLGVAPFSMISGIAAVENGLLPIHGIGMSIIVFAGAAQLAGLQLIGAGAPAIVSILTAWMINLRFMLYSASLSPHFKDRSTRWKALLAYLLTDQAYAVSIIEFENRKDKPGKHWFYFGAAVGLWLTWQVGTALGVFLGTQVPDSWSLDFAIPLTFIALVVPALRDRPALVAGLLAGLIASLGAGLPYNLGLPLAVVTGIGVGMLLERK